MNTYIVHNGFSLFCLLFFSELRSNDCVIIANKNAIKLKEEYKAFFDKNEIVTFSGKSITPFIIKKIFAAKIVYVSSEWHKRMVYFWPAIFLAKKKICIIDEGVASINRNYYKAITKHQSKLIISILRFFVSRYAGFEMKSIFSSESISDNFKKFCKINTVKPFDLNVNKLKKISGNPEVSSSCKEQRVVLILGSPKISSSELLHWALKNIVFKEIVSYKLKDHPLKGGRDDIFYSPEVYTIKEKGKIKCVIGNESSSLVLIKKFFPEIDVINLALDFIEKEDTSGINFYMSKAGIKSFKTMSNELHS